MRYENQNAYFAATNYVFFDDTALKKQSIQSCIDMMLSGLYHSDYKILIHRRVMDILTCASKNSSSEEGCKAAATIRYLDQLIQIGFVKIVGGKGNSLTRVEDLILQYIRKNQPDQPVLVVTQRPRVSYYEKR